MMILDNSITTLIGEVRLTLQVPEFDFVLPGAKPSKLVSRPDSWFCYLKSNNVPCIGKENGYLHLTEAGYSANKSDLKKALLNGIASKGTRGSLKNWNDFENYAISHFAEVRAKLLARINKNNANIVKLNSFTV